MIVRRTYGFDLMIVRPYGCLRKDLMEEAQMNSRLLRTVGEHLEFPWFNRATKGYKDDTSRYHRLQVI